MVPDTEEGFDDVDALSDDALEARLAAGLVDDAPPGAVKVLECPDCGESDLSYVAGMETGHQYQCPHCGYQGALAVERMRTPEELRRHAGRA